MNNTTQAQWKSPVTVVPDPYSSVPAPTQPVSKVLEAVTPVATVAQGYTPNSDATYGYIYGTWVASGTDSCPNTAAQQHYLTYSSTYPYRQRKYLRKLPGIYSRGTTQTVSIPQVSRHTPMTWSFSCPECIT